MGKSASARTPVAASTPLSLPARSSRPSAESTSVDTWDQVFILLRRRRVGSGNGSRSSSGGGQSKLDRATVARPGGIRASGPVTPTAAWECVQVVVFCLVEVGHDLDVPEVVAVDSLADSFASSCLAACGWMGAACGSGGDPWMMLHAATELWTAFHDVVQRPGYGRREVPAIHSRTEAVATLTSSNCSRTRASAVPPRPERLLIEPSTVSTERTSGVSWGEIWARSSALRSVSSIPAA